MQSKALNIHRRIEALEAVIVPAEKPCLTIGFSCPEPERYEEVVEEWPCTRDKSAQPGTHCCHILMWRLKAVFREPGSGPGVATWFGI